MHSQVRTRASNLDAKSPEDTTWSRKTVVARESETRRSPLCSGTSAPLPDASTTSIQPRKAEEEVWCQSPPDARDQRKQDQRMTRRDDWISATHEPAPHKRQRPAYSSPSQGTDYGRKAVSEQRWSPDNP